MIINEETTSNNLEANPFEKKSSDSVQFGLAGKGLRYLFHILEAKLAC